MNKTDEQLKQEAGRSLGSWWLWDAGLASRWAYVGLNHTAQRRWRVSLVAIWSRSSMSPSSQDFSRFVFICVIIQFVFPE